jgi:hypothetical protein
MAFNRLNAKKIPAILIIRFCEFRCGPFSTFRNLNRNFIFRIRKSSGFIISKIQTRMDDPAAARAAWRFCGRFNTATRHYPLDFQALCPQISARLFAPIFLSCFNARPPEFVLSLHSFRVNSAPVEREEVA